MRTPTWCRWISLTLLISLKVTATEPFAGFRLGATGLLPEITPGWGMGLRGGLAWDSGLELSLGVDRANYSSDIKYLGVRGEALLSLRGGSRPWGIGVTGGLGRFMLSQVNGRQFWNVGLVSRVELQERGTHEAAGVRWGAELLALLKKPGAKTLSALAPGIWIQKTF
jgi:hypothetical protein